LSPIGSFALVLFLSVQQLYAQLGYEMPEFYCRLKQNQVIVLNTIDIHDYKALLFKQNALTIT